MGGALNEEGIWGGCQQPNISSGVRGFIIHAYQEQSCELPSGLGLGHVFHTEPGTETLEVHELRVTTGCLLRGKSSVVIRTMVNGSLAAGITDAPRVWTRLFKVM